MMVGSSKFGIAKKEDCMRSLNHMLFILLLACVVSVPNAATPQNRQEIRQLSTTVANLYQEGQYRQALAPAREALVLSEHDFGKQHLTTANNLNNLASVHEALGEYGAALPLYQRALGIVEKKAGPNHPSTSTCLSNLASLYQSMGQYQLALPLFVRALRIVEAAYGVEHPATGFMLNNLASQYHLQGQNDRALPMAQRALQIAEKSLGEDHPSTAIRLQNLAEIFLAMGNYPQALELAERGLLLTEKNRGKSHPQTALALINVAGIWQAMGEFQTALPLLLRAQKMTQDKFGVQHPRMSAVLNNLASVYNALGEYHRAVMLYQQAIAMSEKSTVNQHHSGEPLNNLAELYRSIGAYSLALPLSKRALAIAKQEKGEMHPSTAIRLNNLALLYQAQGDFNTALPLLKRSLAIAESAFGAEHPRTGVVLNNVVTWYAKQQQFAIALPLAWRALRIAEKNEGAEHPATAERLNNLALLYRKLGADVKAVPLYRRALAISLGRAEVDRSSLATTSHNLCIAKQRENISEAIFYCKFAAASTLAQRQANRNMAIHLQQSYLQQVADTYLLLASLLQQSQRDNEGTQVLRLLKAVELEGGEERIPLTTLERNLQGKLLARSKRLHVHRQALAQAQRAQMNKQEMQKITARIEVAKLELFDAYSDIGRAFKDGIALKLGAQLEFPAALDPFLQLQDSLQNTAGNETTALLSFTMQEQQTTVSLYRAQQVQRLQLPYGGDKLNPLIAAMRAGIEDRNDTWRAPARDLYQLLFAPILQADQALAPVAQPSYLMLYLSGQLRSLPIAALLTENGQFFTEKYRFSLYTHGLAADMLLNSANQARQSKQWDILAFGSTQGLAPENLLPLAGVERELTAIVRDANNPDGVLPGERVLDAQFTRQRFTAALTDSQKQRSVLHVASHFRLNRQDWRLSNLLLGDGELFFAKEIAAQQGLSLAQVDLVTLSSCESMVDAVNAGNEFETLAALFHSKGAQAVLGSLWNVQDESTAQWMRHFYVARTEQRLINKAGAVQNAQLAFLRGEASLSDPLKDGKHPYYWAGWMLMGNGAQ